MDTHKAGVTGSNPARGTALTSENAMDHWGWFVLWCTHVVSVRTTNDRDLSSESTRWLCPTGRYTQPAGLYAPRGNSGCRPGAAWPSVRSLWVCRVGGCPCDRIEPEVGFAPLPAGWPRRHAVDARRARGVRHSPSADAHRHQSAGADQIPGRGGSGVLRLHLRTAVR